MKLKYFLLTLLVTGAVAQKDEKNNENKGDKEYKDDKLYEGYNYNRYDEYTGKYGDYEKFLEFGEKDKEFEGYKGRYYNYGKYPKYDEKIKGKYEYFDKDEDYGNPDIYHQIEKPCPKYDTFCIRGFFAEHSKCRIARGPIREPFLSTEFQIYLQNINATATIIGGQLKGLDGLIENFYIDRATGNLVLVVYFDSVKISSRQGYFRFFREGKEPVEASDKTEIEYKQLTVTIVIPNYENLELDKAEISGYLGDAFPPFLIGPGVLRNPDPAVIAAIKGLYEDIPTAAKENMLTVAPLVGKIFVQRMICDFFLPVNRIGVKH